MARYTGPKVRVSRRLGTNIFENEKGRKALERRPFPPGAHGRTRRRNAGSEYLAQLQEKQKAKYIYGVLERQFRNTYEEAVRLVTIPAAVNNDGPIIAVMVALYFLLLLVAYFRVGLLTVAVGNLVLYVLNQMPIGTDVTAWHSSYMIAAVVGFIAIAAWAFHTSLGGQKLFKGSLLED